MRVAGERCHFDIKPPLPIFPRGYLLKSFTQGDISAKQRWFEIIVFPLIDELPKAIEPQLPVYQSYRWQLGPNKSCLPMFKSFDHIVVTALRVGFPGESLRPATGRFACNCPMPELGENRGVRGKNNCTLHSVLFLQEGNLPLKT